MNKQRLFWVLIAIAFVVALIGVLHHMAEGKRYFTTMISYNVGRELIEATNSSLVVTVGPDLHTKLSQLLASTTHIASVQLGDEPAPVGDGRASSRVILTNDLAHGLGIRLRLRPDATDQRRFEVLGFWTIGEPNGTAHKSQPYRSDTNRTLPAVGSPR